MHDARVVKRLYYMCLFGATTQSLALLLLLIVDRLLRVRLHIIRNGRIENVGKSQSCMVSKLRIICKQTVAYMYVPTDPMDLLGIISKCEHLFCKFTTIHRPI